MILTKSYTRITARPWSEYCPRCGAEVVDWFLEWYLPQDQKKIAHHEAAMDCPFCHEGVMFDRQFLVRPYKNVPILKRDFHQAERWAELNGYATLEDYLFSGELEQGFDRSEPFREGYWPQVKKMTGSLIS